MSREICPFNFREIKFTRKEVTVRNERDTRKDPLFVLGRKDLDRWIRNLVQKTIVSEKCETLRKASFFPKLFLFSIILSNCLV